MWTKIGVKNTAPIGQGSYQHVIFDCRNFWQAPKPCLRVPANCHCPRACVCVWFLRVEGKVNLGFRTNRKKTTQMKRSLRWLLWLSMLLEKEEKRYRKQKKRTFECSPILFASRSTDEICLFIWCFRSWLHSTTDSFDRSRSVCFNHPIPAHGTARYGNELH